MRESEHLFRHLFSKIHISVTYLHTHYLFPASQRLFSSVRYQFAVSVQTFSRTLTSFYENHMSRYDSIFFLSLSVAVRLSCFTLVDVCYKPISYGLNAEISHRSHDNHVTGNLINYSSFFRHRNVTFTLAPTCIYSDQSIRLDLPVFIYLFSFILCIFT